MDVVSDTSSSSSEFGAGLRENPPDPQTENWPDVRDLYMNLSDADAIFASDLPEELDHPDTDQFLRDRRDEYWRAYFENRVRSGEMKTRR